MTAPDDVRARFEAAHGITWEAIQSLPIGGGSRLHLESNYTRHFETWKAAHATALADMAKRMEAAERDAAEVCALLPSCYYMDPPDGGDVNVVEQLRRMAKDAARYRFLKEQNATIDSPDAWTITRCDFPDADGPARYWVGSDLDAAIDAATQEGEG